MATPITTNNEKFTTHPNQFGGTPMVDAKNSSMKYKGGRNNSVSGGAIVGNHGLNF